MRNVQTVVHERRRRLVTATLVPVLTALLLILGSGLSGAALASSTEPPGEEPPGEGPPRGGPPGEEPPTPAVKTCTVTLTLVDMLVITATGPGEDTWVIGTSSATVGHDATPRISADADEVEEINRTVGTKTLPKAAFPHSESLYVSVEAIAERGIPSPIEPGRFIENFGDAHETYDLECPQDREEHVVVKGEYPHGSDFEVVLKYRYRVKED